MTSKHDDGGPASEMTMWDKAFLRALPIAAGWFNAGDAIAESAGQLADAVIAEKCKREGGRETPEERNARLKALGFSDERPEGGVADAIGLKRLGEMAGPDELEDITPEMVERFLVHHGGEPNGIGAVTCYDEDGNACNVDPSDVVGAIKTLAFFDFNGKTQNQIVEEIRQLERDRVSASADTFIAEQGANLDTPMVVDLPVGPDPIPRDKWIQFDCRGRACWVCEREGSYGRSLEDADALSTVKVLVNGSCEYARGYGDALAVAKAQAEEPDLDTCPTCGGESDNDNDNGNGNDRCVPPNPYECTKCTAKRHSYSCTCGKCLHCREKAFGPTCSSVVAGNDDFSDITAGMVEKYLEENDWVYSRSSELWSYRDAVYLTDESVSGALESISFVTGEPQAEVARKIRELAKRGEE